MIRLSANKKIIYRYSCYAHAKCLKTGYTTDYSNKFCCILHSSFLNSIIFTSNFFCKVFSNFLKYMKLKPGKLYYILHNDLSCCYITTFRLSTYTKIGIFDYFFCLEHQHGRYVYCLLCLLGLCENQELAYMNGLSTRNRFLIDTNIRISVYVER